MTMKNASSLQSVVSCEVCQRAQRQSARARYVVENYRLANTSSNLSKETETA